MGFLSQLDDDNERLKAFDSEEELAQFCSTVVRPRIEEAAALAAKIEERVDPSFWGMPRVCQLLFR
jgi:glutamine synthetase type III